MGIKSLSLSEIKILWISGGKKQGEKREKTLIEGNTVLQAAIKLIAA